MVDYRSVSARHVAILPQKTMLVYDSPMFRPHLNRRHSRRRRSEAAFDPHLFRTGLARDLFLEIPLRNESDALLSMIVHVLLA